MPYDDLYIMAGELTHIYAGAWGKKSPGRKVNASIGVVMSDIYLWSLSEIKSQKQTLHSNGDLKQKRQGEPKKTRFPIYARKNWSSAVSQCQFYWPKDLFVLGMKFSSSFFKTFTETLPRM